MKNFLSDEQLKARRLPREVDLRGDYFRDITAIIHSTPFRRLKHKTQAFYAPQNDHICTRIEHVLHVSTIAVTICRALGLDADMAQAIALAHDLGHAPFGHEGERVLNNRARTVGGFIHELHGLRVVDVIARGGQGLNLTYAVRDGLVSHCGEIFDQRLVPCAAPRDLSTLVDRGHAPGTYEGCVVRFADKVAYLGRDLEDAITAKFITIDEVDPVVRAALGTSNGQIIGTLVGDIVEESRDKDYIGFSNEKMELVRRLYAFNKERIYRHPRMERYRIFCQRIIEGVFEYLYGLFTTHGWSIAPYRAGVIPLDRQFGGFLEEMQVYYTREQTASLRIVADYVAGMTDDYAIESIKQINIPRPVDINWHEGE
ncbi:MAG: HD domain-containing protein [Peptococcaceae bacterium]|nr:HD domain-containing protein [Peptococcaceae bacterium]